MRTGIKNIKNIYIGQIKFKKNTYSLACYFVKTVKLIIVRTLHVAICVLL